MSTKENSKAGNSSEEKQDSVIEKLKVASEDPKQSDKNKNIFEWYTYVLGKYFEFGGRATRREYWSFYLANLIISFFLGVFEGLITLNLEYQGSVLGTIYSLFLFFPALALTFRRFHDTGKSGWYLLLGLIPYFGAIVLFIFTLLPSDDGENKYGPDPRV